MTAEHKRTSAPDADVRFTREQWLARSLEVLAREGNAKLRVDSISKSIGVTKGSFYWHFQNRQDFVVSLVHYWDSAFTDPAIAHVQNHSGDAQSRLWALAEFVSREKLARYEVCIRAWAAQDSSVAEVVANVDEKRLSFVRSLFSEMGCKEQELEMRTRAFIGYLSYEPAVFAVSSEKDRAEMLKHFCEMVTQK